MIRIATFFVFVLILQGASCQESADVLKVMSYNIRLDAESDKENNWHHRKAELAKWVGSENVDFLGVQEALPHQMDYLDSTWQNMSYVGVGRDNGHRAGEFSAVFYDSQKWNISSTNTYWLSENPHQPGLGWDAVCNRVFTWAVFENATKQRVLVINTHFDHVGKEARKNSIVQITDFVKQFEPQLPTVVMGDFNFTPDNECYPVIESRMTDASKFAKTAENGKAGTFNGFQTKGDFDRRIDYLFINDLVKPVNYEMQQPKTKVNLQLSDHFPVSLTFKI